MDLTERIQMLLCQARHPSATVNRRLEIRGEIQRLQNLRSAQEAGSVSPNETNPKT